MISDSFFDVIVVFALHNSEEIILVICLTKNCCQITFVTISMNLICVLDINICCICFTENSNRDNYYYVFDIFQFLS